MLYIECFTVIAVLTAELSSSSRCHAQVFDFKNNYFTEMCSGSEEGSYFRLTGLFASLNSRRESHDEEEEKHLDPTVAHLTRPAVERTWHT